MRKNFKKRGVVYGIENLLLISLKTDALSAQQMQSSYQGLWRLYKY